MTMLLNSHWVGQTHHPPQPYCPWTAAGFWRPSFRLAFGCSTWWSPYPGNQTPPHTPGPRISRAESNVPSWGNNNPQCLLSPLPPSRYQLSEQAKERGIVISDYKLPWQVFNQVILLVSSVSDLHVQWCLKIQVCNCRIFMSVQMTFLNLSHNWPCQWNTKQQLSVVSSSPWISSPLGTGPESCPHIYEVF